MPLLFTPPLGGGGAHYVFDTRAITLFSHPQMNTAKLQTPAVTLLQISHNSLNVSQAVKNYTAAPFPSSTVPSEHPTSCHSHYSCSPNLTLNVERGNEWSRKRFNYQTLWSKTNTHPLCTRDLRRFY